MRGNILCARAVCAGSVCGSALSAAAAPTPIAITFEPSDGIFLPPATVVDNQYLATQFIDFNASANIELDAESSTDFFESRAAGSFLTSVTLEMTSAPGRAFEYLSFDLGILQQQTILVQAYDAMGVVVFSQSYTDNVPGEADFNVDISGVGAFTRVTLADSGSTFGVDNIFGSTEIQGGAIPLPPPAALASAGICGLVFVRRRRG